MSIQKLRELAGLSESTIDMVASEYKTKTYSELKALKEGFETDRLNLGRFAWEYQHADLELNKIFFAMSALEESEAVEKELKILKDKKDKLPKKNENDDKNQPNTNSNAVLDESKGVEGPVAKIGDNTGIKQMQEDKITIPKNVLSDLHKRIEEVTDSIENYGNKGYSEKSGMHNVLDALEQILVNLNKENREGLFQANQYWMTLTNSITDCLPPSLILFLTKKPE